MAPATVSSEAPSSDLLREEEWSGVIVVLRHAEAASSGVKRGEPTYITADLARDLNKEGAS